jgi:hypothetical protein
MVLLQYLLMMPPGSLLHQLESKSPRSYQYEFVFNGHIQQNRLYRPTNVAVTEQARSRSNPEQAQRIRLSRTEENHAPQLLQGLFDQVWRGT